MIILKDENYIFQNNFWYKITPKHKVVYAETPL